MHYNNNYKKDNYTLITIEDALKIIADSGFAVPTYQTINNWCRKYKLGHQLGGKGGRWVIYKEKLEEFLYGTDKETTEK